MGGLLKQDTTVGTFICPHCCNGGAIRSGSLTRSPAARIFSLWCATLHQSQSRLAARVQRVAGRSRQRGEAKRHICGAYCANAFASSGAISCSNHRVVTTRRQPVVTTRAMSLPSKTYRWLAQVTTPSDGLPDPSSIRTAQYGLPSCLLPAGIVNTAPSKRPSEPWVNGSNRWNSFQQESTIDAKNGCSRGK